MAIRFGMGQSPYLLIHYDVTEEPVRIAIRAAPGLIPQTESVFVIAPGELKEAVAFWKHVAAGTQGRWQRDDKLFIHFVNGTLGGTVWREIINVVNSSLEADPDQKFDAYWLGQLTNLWTP